MENTINFDFLKKVKGPSPESQEPQKVIFKMIQSPESMASMVRSKMSEADLIENIGINYNTILTAALESQTGEFNDVLQNPTFLGALYKVVEKTPADAGQKKNICKMVYQYLMLESKDNYIASLMESLGELVNKPQVKKLNRILQNNDNYIPILLSVARFAKDDLLAGIAINRILLSLPMHKMTEQNVVDIYSVLFERLTPLFNATMLYYDNRNLSNPQQEIFGTISLAILDLLEGMPMQAIEQVLRGYEEKYRELKMQYPDLVIRFSMYTANRTDYPRINQMLDMLKNAGVYIP